MWTGWRLAVLVGAACSPYGGGAFVCDDDLQCSNGALAGVCEPVGYCSFADPGCGSGRRFADSAGGGMAGDCVAAPDARAPDAPMPDAPAPVCEPQPSLVACYRFEGDLLDESGQGNHATPTTEGFVPGVDGMAMHAIATTEAHVAESPSLDVAQLTIETWIRPAELPVVGARAGLFDNNGQYGLFLLPGGDLVCTGGGSQVVVTGVVPVGVWTHVACTYDGSTRIVYVNGVAIATLAGGGPLPVDVNDGSAIAGNVPSGDPFVGDMDNLRLWNVARLPGQICQAAACD